MFGGYLNKGMCAIPLKAGKPLVEWSRFYESLPLADEVRQWDSPEMAILCGKISGVIGLDIDVDDEDRIYHLAGHTPVRKKGSKGFTAFYRYNGEPSRVWKKNGVVVAEILSDKRLTTIPPSPHRSTGKPYFWMDWVGLLDIDSLPAISADFYTLMDALFPKPEPKKSPYEYERDYENEQVTLEQAANMLDYISSDCPRDEWISIGMALRHTFGDAASNLWHDWSAKAGKRYNYQAAAASWRSFDSTGYTIATIIYKAKEHGWLPAPEEVTYVPKVDVQLVEPSFNAKQPIKSPEQAPNLVGLIQQEILKTALYPQPNLALAASIALAGTLMAHKVQSTSGLRTNIYTLGFAPSGAGKEHQRQMVVRLLKEAGMIDHYLGTPASSAGLLYALHKANGRAIMQIDELGHFLKMAGDKNASGFLKEVTTYFTQLFSSYNSVFVGKEYSQRAEKVERVDIDQPCFSIFGTTVPSRFYEAISGSDVVDGFLSRWLIFETDEYVIDAEEIDAFAETSQILSGVLDFWAKEPTNANARGNIDISIRPRIVSKSGEAQSASKAFQRDCRRMIANKPEDIAYCAVWARASEHAEKLALVGHSGDKITMDVMDWAISIAKQSAGLILSAVSDNMSSNESEAEAKKLLSWIKAQRRWVSRNEIVRANQWLKKNRRNEILSDLIESGLVEFEESKAESGNKIQMFRKI